MRSIALQNKKISYIMYSAAGLVALLSVFGVIKVAAYLHDQTATNDTVTPVAVTNDQGTTGAAESTVTGGSPGTSTAAGKTGNGGITNPTPAVTGGGSSNSSSSGSSSGSTGGGSSSGGGGTTTPTPSPPVASVSHGSQINTSNTGYLAWVGPSGERCTDSNITVYNSSVNASSLGTSKTCVYFKGGINIDAPITLTACKVDGIINSTYSFRRVVLNYCTIKPASPSDWSLGPGNFSATRSQILGSSDGVRFASGYNDVLIENYIRLKAQGPTDHNDGIQMYVPTGGGTILRNNIDARPVGGGGGTNAAIFIADNATGTYEIRDNYLAGGGFTLRLHESGYYRATGNIIEKDSYVYGPFTHGASIPGAFLEWLNNKTSDGAIISL